MLLAPGRIEEHCGTSLRQQSVLPKACWWQAGATLYLRNSDRRELLWSRQSPYFCFPVAVPFSQAKPAKAVFQFCFVSLIPIPPCVSRHLEFVELFPDRKAPQHNHLSEKEMCASSAGNFQP